MRMIIAQTNLRCLPGYNSRAALDVILQDIMGFMHRVVNVLLIFGLLLSACGTAIKTGGEIPSNQPESTILPEAGITPISGELQQVVLTVWMPDTFPGHSISWSQKMLEDQILLFVSSHPGVEVDLRFKNIQTSQGMTELLSTTYLVAPSLLPDLALLTQSEMESAAIKGMIIPMDGLGEVAAKNKLLPPFLAPSMIQGSSFALPAAGDALLLLSEYPLPGENSWQSIQTYGNRVAAGLNDVDGTLFIALYLSMGGSLLDSDNRPYIDPVILKEVLTSIRQMWNSHTFTETSLHSGWMEGAQTFNAGEVASQVNWYSLLGDQQPERLQINSLPGISATPATLATGWYWAAANTNPLHFEARRALLEALTDPTFASPWSMGSGYLPVSDQGWPVLPEEQAALTAILAAARSLPDSSLLATVGPVFREAALSALTSSKNIDEIVSFATERINQ